MQLRPEILRSSFELVVDRNPQVVARFYEILFARYPEVRPLFGVRNSAEVQQTMLTEALVAVVDHLEDAPWLSSTLKGIGAKHVSYGVTDEMYDWVGECLLAAMSEVAADAWTAEVEGQWVAAYGVIAAMCLEGAEEERLALSA